MTSLQDMMVASHARDHGRQNANRELRRAIATFLDARENDPPRAPVVEHLKEVDARLEQESERITAAWN